MKSIQENTPLNFRNQTLNIRPILSPKQKVNSRDILELIVMDLNPNVIPPLLLRAKKDPKNALGRKEGREERIVSR